MAWRAIPTTTIAVIDRFLDVDVDPDNGNEIISLNNLPVTGTSALIDTSRLLLQLAVTGGLLLVWLRVAKPEE